MAWLKPCPSDRALRETLSQEGAVVAVDFGVFGGDYSGAGYLVVGV